MYLIEALFYAVLFGIAFFAILYLVSAVLILFVVVPCAKALRHPMGRFVFALLLALLLFTAAAHAGDGRPGKWCGWYARKELVTQDPGPAFNRACEWLKYGSPTSAQVGAIVVWCNGNHHHVGKITGTDANGNFIVKSGNDGHAVRERVRSVAGASFRTAW